MIDEIVKGDAIDFYCNMEEDITGWAIRAELWDAEDRVIEKGNALAGGDATQIEVTNLITGEFLVHIEPGETIDFLDIANIEVEVEVNGKKYTVLKDGISFRCKRIDWTTPNPNPPS